MSSSIAHYRPHNVPQTPPPHEKDLVLDQWLHPTTLKRRSSLDELDGDRGGHHSFFGIDEDTALAHEDTARANEEWDDVSAQPRREGSSSALDARMCTPCDASHALHPTSKFPPLPFFEGPAHDASMRRKSSLDDVQIARHKQNFGIDEDTVLKEFTDLAGKFELRRDGQQQPMPTRPPASGHDLDELWSTSHRPPTAPATSIGPRYAVPTHTSSTEPQGPGFVRRVSENVRRVSEKLDSRSLHLEDREATTTPVLSRVALRATLSNDRLSSMVRIPSVGSTTSVCASISREDEGRNGSFDSAARFDTTPSPQQPPMAPTPKTAPPAIASPTPSLKQLDRFLTAMEQTQRSQSKHSFCYQEMIALQRETSHSRGQLLQWVCGSLASGGSKGGMAQEKANDDRTTFVRAVSNHAHVERKRTLPHHVSYECHPVRETKRARIDPPTVPSMTTINTATLDGEGRLQAELRRIAREQIVEMERRMRYNGQAA